MKTEVGKGAQSDVVKDTEGSWGVVSGTPGSAGKSSQSGIRTICGESGPLSREQGGSSVLCLPVSSLLRPKELGNYSDSTETAPVENHICSAAEGPLLTSFKAVFMPVAYGLVFLLGLTGNILVLAVLERHRHTRSSTETFLFHLAAADLLLVLILPLGYLSVAITVGEFLGLAHCCLNPVLYTFAGVKFRSDLSRVLAKLGCTGPAALCQFLPAWRKSSLSESENATSLTTF
ncbi:PREDICTED: C-X-C chemokine receptor type 5 [Myotis brandtii]|uniref:C-X-C chemokine receptor type 5 n=1 Tax=Myotis brandtii TaxID=109478 RepID=UPI000703FDA9|nr:PREDICTED: C-X-C chemokine receptor type 5 [Myotis brandtii]